MRELICSDRRMPGIQGDLKPFVRASNPKIPALSMALIAGKIMRPGTAFLY